MEHQERSELVKKHFPRFAQLELVGSDDGKAAFIICDETSGGDLYKWRRLFMVPGPGVAIHYIGSCKAEDIDGSDWNKLKEYWTEHFDLMKLEIVNPSIKLQPRNWKERVSMFFNPKKTCTCTHHS